MDLGLSDRVALVAASSRGLGLAVAEELGREGARLVLCARGESTLEESRAALASAGCEVVALPADLSRAEDIERVVGTATDAFGRIDVLVTNTGGPPAGNFLSHSQDVWRAAIDNNLHSVLQLVRGVLPGMKKRRWGRILNITSVAVKQPVDDLILSNSIRAAVTGFAKTLSDEVAGFGITVNNLLPGFTRTARLESLATSIAARQNRDAPGVISDWERTIPMRRLGDPREFAALAAFLASERASYITGTSIPVDGGWTRGLF